MMEWSAFGLSLRLAGLTVALLLPIGIAAAHALAFGRWPGRRVLEAVVALPLVLPPTVLGYYLLVALGARSPIGAAWQGLFGHGLAFSFSGLVVASVIVNLPFAVQPIQRAFEALPPDMREAAWVSGLSPRGSFWRVELPLAWPGVLSALVLTFAHTMGEFGVVLMVGGGIPGVTRTAALAIYDRAQAFDDRGAAAMSGCLVLFSVAAIAVANVAGGRRHA